LAWENRCHFPCSVVITTGSGPVQYLAAYYGSFCSVTNFPIFLTLLIVIVVNASFVYLSLLCTLSGSASSLAQAEITQAKQSTYFQALQKLQLRELATYRCDDSLIVVPPSQFIYLLN